MKAPLGIEDNSRYGTGLNGVRMEDIAEFGGDDRRGKGVEARHASNMKAEHWRVIPRGPLRDQTSGLRQFLGIAEIV